MSSAPDLATKPSDAKSSREIAASQGVTADLLTSADLGVKITGLVLSVEKPRNPAGTSSRGKAYSFWILEVQLWTGNKAVPCVFRADSEDGLPQVPVGVKGSFRVTNARVDNGQMRFDIAA